VSNGHRKDGFLGAAEGATPCFDTCPPSLLIGGRFDAIIGPGGRMPDAPSVWDIASTIATVGATAVALTVPFILDRLQRGARVAELATAKRDAALEIVFAASEALAAYDDAQKALQLRASAYETAQLRDIEERGWRASKVIDHLMQRRDLTDRVMRCGVDGAALGIETGHSIQRAYPSTAEARSEALDYCAFHKVRAARLRTQISDLYASI
jgi:hypothetical protein